MSQHITNLAHYLREEKISFIIGAGASVKAGIPLASGIVKMIQQDFAYCIEGLSEKDREDYGKVMRALAPNQRKRLIEPLLKDAKLNWGHITFARIVQQQSNVKRVLSFNFDFLLEKAFGLLGEHLPVYDFGVSPTRDINGFAEPGLFHLHGQGYGLRLLNTEDETQTHAKQLEPLLADTLCRHTTIIAGYSGVNDGAFEVMKRVYNNNCRLFWLGYQKEPPAHLNDLLAKDYAKYIGGCDFDLTMIDLARELKLWPLPIIDNPPQHVLDLLAPLPDFPTEAKSDAAVLHETRLRLERSAESWADDRSDEEIEAAALMADLPLNDDEDISAYSEKAKHLRAIRYYNHAVDLQEAPQPVSEAGKARKDIISHYAKAVEIKPDYQDALYNWGNALSDEAQTLTGDDQRQTYAEACEKYAKAIEIKRDDHVAFYNWGNALAEEAQTLSGDDQRKTYAEACEKYAKAVEIKPDKHVAFNNWGAALLNEAHKLEDEERHQALNAALEKLNQAKAITGKANYNLACAYTLLDNHQAALDELEACARDGTLLDAAHLRADSDLDALRDEPRFQALLAGV